MIGPDDCAVLKDQHATEDLSILDESAFDDPDNNIFLFSYKFKYYTSGELSGRVKEETVKDGSNCGCSGTSPVATYAYEYLILPKPSVNDYSTPYVKVFFFQAEDGIRDHA